MDIQDVLNGTSSARHNVSAAQIPGPRKEKFHNNAGL
jgi:hypothetical protein